MEIKNIMNADILDIIFEGRNKDYGAYDLRRTYNRRLVKALMSMAGILVFLFTGYFYWAERRMRRITPCI
jgi:protein TonB